jgi:hypothetical protein
LVAHLLEKGVRVFLRVNQVLRRRGEEGRERRDVQPLVDDPAEGAHSRAHVARLLHRTRRAAAQDGFIEPEQIPPLELERLEGLVFENRVAGVVAPRVELEPVERVSRALSLSLPVASGLQRFEEGEPCPGAGSGPLDLPAHLLALPEPEVTLGGRGGLRGESAGLFELFGDSLAGVEAVSEAGEQDLIPAVAEG